MKKDIHPGIVAAAILGVIVIVGMFLWKSAAGKPDYPGANAGHPSAEMQGAGGGKRNEMPTKVLSKEEAVKAHIPGVSQPPPGQ